MTSHSLNTFFRLRFGDICVEESLLIIAENMFVRITRFEWLFGILRNFSSCFLLRRALSVFKLFLYIMSDFGLRTDQNIRRFDNNFSVRISMIFVSFAGVIRTDVFIRCCHAT